MLLGDNLADFAGIFENRSEYFGFNIVDENKYLFGNKYFIFPNPMYGSWEKAVFGGSMKFSAEEKDSLRKTNLIGY
jgi:predicted secreted acid phosphatase